MQQTEVRNETVRIRNRLQDHKRLVWLRIIGMLHILYGALLLVLLLIYVWVWSVRGEGAFADEIRKGGYPSESGALVLFCWIAIAVLHIAAGRALREELPRGRWMASLASVWMLSTGLFQIANATAGFFDTVMFVVFPLLSLFVVNVVAVDYLQRKADSG